MRHSPLTNAIIATVIGAAILTTCGRGAERTDPQPPPPTVPPGAAVVIAVDTSGSMRPNVNAVGTNLSTVIDVYVSPTLDELALVTFDDSVDVVTGRASIRTALMGLRSGGSRTLLFQALSRSLDLLEMQPKSPDRAVIVVSDGGDESSVHADATDQVIKRATAMRALIHSVFIGQPVAASRNTMIRLSERTGGKHTDIGDPQRIPRALEDVIRTAFKR